MSSPTSITSRHTHEPHHSDSILPQCHPRQKSAHARPHAFPSLSPTISTRWNPGTSLWRINRHSEWVLRLQDPLWYHLSTLGPTHSHHQPQGTWTRWGKASSHRHRCHKKHKWWTTRPSTTHERLNRRSYTHRLFSLKRSVTSAKLINRVNLSFRFWDSTDDHTMRWSTDRRWNHLLEASSQSSLHNSWGAATCPSLNGFDSRYQKKQIQTDKVSVCLP